MRFSTYGKRDCLILLTRYSTTDRVYWALASILMAPLLTNSYPAKDKPCGCVGTVMVWWSCSVEAKSEGMLSETTRPFRLAPSAINNPRNLNQPAFCNRTLMFRRFTHKMADEKDILKEVVEVLQDGHKSFAELNISKTHR